MENGFVFRAFFCQFWVMKTVVLVRYSRWFLECKAEFVKVGVFLGSGREPFLGRISGRCLPSTLFFVLFGGNQREYRIVHILILTTTPMRNVRLAMGRGSNIERICGSIFQRGPFLLRKTWKKEGSKGPTHSIR